MDIRALTIISLCAIWPAVAGSAIYKSYDEDGNVVFSDTPPNKNAVEVEVGPINTIPAAELTPRPNTTADQEIEGVAYTVVIDDPVHDQAIRSNNGDFTVSVSVKPPLVTDNGDELVLKLDDEEVSRGPDTSIDLQNVSRGTHTISAVIENQDGEMQASAEPIQVHVQRVSILNQPKPPPPPPPQPSNS